MRENELVALAKQGDEECFRILVESNMRRIFKLAYQYVGNYHDAEDISQEAFIRAFNSLPTFKGRSSFSTWLYRIAINCCLNFRRKRNNWREESFNIMNDKSSYVYNHLNMHKSFNPEKELWHKEMMQRVEESLDSLSSKQKMIFVLRYYRHFSIKEIGEAMNCAEGTIKKQLFRAMKGIRKQLNGFI